ncbi:hypothetical protein Tco_1150070 [Tanacetum coccineum]
MEKLAERAYAIERGLWTTDAVSSQTFMIEEILQWQKYYHNMGRVFQTRLRRQGVKLPRNIDLEFKIVNEYSVRVNQRGADDDGDGGMSWGWWCGAAMVVSRVAYVGGSGGGGVVRGGVWVEDQIDRVAMNVSGLGRKTRRKSFPALVGRKRWRSKVGGGRIMREK